MHHSVVRPSEAESYVIGRRMRCGGILGLGCCMCSGCLSWLPLFWFCHHVKKRYSDLSTEDTMSMIFAQKPLIRRTSQTQEACKIYMIGVVIVSYVEIVLLMVLSLSSSFMYTATIFVLLFLFLSIALTLQFHDSNRLLRMRILCWLFTVLLGIMGGLAGGDQLQQLWTYRNSHVVLWARAGGNYPSKTVIEFSNQTSYIASHLVGTSQLSGNTYCVAPILGKDHSPLTKVNFWAVAQGCCDTTNLGAGMWCHSSWNGEKNVGEVVMDRNDTLFSAMSSSAIRNNLEVNRFPVWLDMLTMTEHERRQNDRLKIGTVLLATNPIVWPVLPLTLMLGGMLLQFVCGVIPKT